MLYITSTEIYAMKSHAQKNKMRKWLQVSIEFSNHYIKS
jgi:hypothetical protein